MRCADQAKSTKRRFVNLVLGKYIDLPRITSKRCSRGGGEVVLGGICKLVGL